MLVDADLLHRVETFRHRNRFPTRSEAITYLLNYALSKNPKPAGRRTVRLVDEGDESE